MHFRLHFIVAFLVAQASAKQGKRGQNYKQQQVDLTAKRLDNSKPNQECPTELLFMGIDYSMMGYNILYGFPMESGMDPGFRLPIFNKTFDHDTYTPDCLYMIPKGFDAETPVACVTSFTASEVKNEQELSNSLSNEVSSEFKGWGFSFSASTSYQAKTEDMANSESKYVYSTARCDYYFVRLDTIQPPPLHQTFVSFLKELNDTDDKQKYFELFDNFGTHYLKQAHIGARYTHEYKLTKEQYDHVHESQFSVSAQAEFASIVTLSGGDSLSADQKQAAKEFSSSSTSKTITVGATPEGNGDDPDAWASTVKDYPLPMHITLGSIEEIFQPQFFTDLQINFKRIQSNIIRYKGAYCNYLEVERGVRHACGNSSTQSVSAASSAGVSGGPTYIQDCQSQITYTGISYIMMGYNIFYGYPMQAGMDPGFKHSIFKIAFTNNSFTPDCVYRVPDGLQVVSALACVTTFSADEVQSEHDFSNALSNEASASFKGFGVHFSASSGYKKNVQDMRNSHSTFVYSSAVCDYFFSRIDPYIPPPFHDSFVIELQKLQNDTNNKELYFQFFEMFGTHFVTAAYNGARYTHEYRLSTEQYDHASQSSFSISLQAEYESIFSLSGGDKLTDEQQQAAKDFASHSSKSTVTVGALPTPGGDPDAWASNVKTNPLPMKFSLASIDGLFEEQFFRGLHINYTKIKTAVLKYLPEYCQFIENATGLTYVCKEQPPSCDLNAPGPHSSECLNHWWLSAGCKQDGTASPDKNDTTVNYWNRLSARNAFLNMRSYKINADNEVLNYYSLCYGTSSDCLLYTRPPHRLPCLTTWWINAGCELDGALSPLRREGIKIWDTMDGSQARMTMVAVRRQMDAGNVGSYQDCIEEDGICPLEGGVPQTQDCLNSWWFSEGCIKEGTASPQLNKDNVRKWTSMSAEDVRADMHKIHAQALKDDPQGAFSLCFGSLPDPPQVKVYF